MSRTTFERRIVRLEVATTDSERIIVCPVDKGYDSACPVAECACESERLGFFMATRGRGSFVVIPHEMRDV